MEWTTAAVLMMLIFAVMVIVTSFISARKG
jgi:hypothetical protein